MSIPETKRINTEPKICRRMPRNLNGPARMFNTAIQAYHSAMQEGAYVAALDALMSFNAMLPDDPDPNDDDLREFQVVLSNTIYDRKVASALIAQCPACGKTSKFSPDSVTTRHVDDSEKMGALRPPALVPDTREVWTCPLCNAKTDLTDVNGQAKLRTGREEVPQPSLLGVVSMYILEPDLNAPNGLENWQRYMRTWLINFHVELAAKGSKYFRYLAERGQLGGEVIGDEYTGE